ncbi:VIT1/CCC1 transporter family protein [Actinospica durhamensis]|uniref:VIT1/CCC1 transporter family protein n=1 Tax=Actinospica durhamensis TaxID=1508375 RepID=A0A941EMI0_9ACTN|nr:VIT1/CCC1 transporter family protein [Actinospica durhamensis]MBR7833841.1 VIT1/CCC1 transporter family protein [Actinospica durhamensis]
MPAADKPHPPRNPGPPPPHHHRDVSGGWLRPAVFGAMDGLVTNVSLISGVGAGGGSAHTVALTGIAGLVAGAFSMATGEYVSVSSQNELVQAEVAKERHELKRNPIGERLELAAAFVAQGVDPDLAHKVVEQISAQPDQGLKMHVREELGVDPHDLPSPWTAAGASFASFTLGAIIPLAPYLFGAQALWLALLLSALGALIGGGAVGKLTSRPVWFSAVRQLGLAAVAAGATYLIGTLIGTSVG